MFLAYKIRPDYTESRNNIALSLLDLSYRLIRLIKTQVESQRLAQIRTNTRTTSTRTTVAFKQTIAPGYIDVQMETQVHFIVTVLSTPSQRADVNHSSSCCRKHIIIIWAYYTYFRKPKGYIYITLVHLYYISIDNSKDYIYASNSI